VAGGLGAIRWLLRPDGVSYVFISEESRCRAVVAEMSVVVGLGFVVFIIQQFKGLLPIV
jgi:hypothetical protein